MPTYVTKNLAAASSTGVGSFSSAGVVTLNTSSLGTARRIIVWGSTSIAGNIVVTGVSESGTPISETVVGSTIGTEVATIQDYLRLTSVTVPAGVNSTQGYIGTNTQGGTPWKVVDTFQNPTSLTFSIDLTSPSTVVAASFEYTMDYPSYNPATGLWAGQSPTTGPRPTISSLGSTVTTDTVGSISAAIAAWRITVTSTSSGAGSLAASVVQAGVY